MMNFQILMTKFTRFQKYFNKSGSFFHSFEKWQFWKANKNYFIEFKYWDFGIRENEFLRSFRFYKRKYIHRFGWRACRGQGKFIKNIHFNPKIGHKLVQMIEIGISRIRTPTKVEYFLSSLKFSDLNSNTWF